MPKARRSHSTPEPLSDLLIQRAELTETLAGMLMDQRGYTTLERKLKALDRRVLRTRAQDAVDLRARLRDFAAMLVHQEDVADPTMKEFMAIVRDVFHLIDRPRPGPAPLADMPDGKTLH